MDAIENRSNRLMPSNMEENESLPPRQPFRGAQNPKFVREPRGPPILPEPLDDNAELVHFKRKSRTTSPKRKKATSEKDNHPYDDALPSNQHRSKLEALIAKYRARPELVMTLEDRELLKPAIKEWTLKRGYHFDHPRLKGHSINLKRINRERQQILDSHPLDHKQPKKPDRNQKNIFGELLGNPCKAKWYGTYQDLQSWKSSNCPTLPKLVHWPEIPIQNSKNTLYTKTGSHSHVFLHPPANTSIVTETEVDEQTRDNIDSPSSSTPPHPSESDDQYEKVIKDFLSSTDTPDALKAGIDMFLNFKSLVPSHPRSTCNRAGAYAALLPRNQSFDGVNPQIYITAKVTHHHQRRDKESCQSISIDELILPKTQANLIGPDNNDTVNDQLYRLLVSMGTTVCCATRQELGSTIGPYALWHPEFLQTFTKNIQEYLQVGLYIPCQLSPLKDSSIIIQHDEALENCELNDQIYIHEIDFPPNFPLMNSFSLLDGKRRSEVVTVQKQNKGPNITIRDLESLLPRRGERFTYAAMQKIIKTLCSYSTNNEQLGPVMYYDPVLELQQQIEIAQSNTNQEELQRLLCLKSNTIAQLSTTKRRRILVILNYFPHNSYIQMEVLAVCNPNLNKIFYFCPYQPNQPIKSWTPIEEFRFPSPSNDPFSLSQQIEKLKLHLDFISPVPNGWTNSDQFIQNRLVDKLSISDMNHDRLMLCKYTDLMIRHFHDSKLFVPWKIGKALSSHFVFKGADYEDQNQIKTPKARLDHLLPNFQRGSESETTQVPQDLLDAMFAINAQNEWSLPYLSARYYDLVRNN